MSARQRSVVSVQSMSISPFQARPGSPQSEARRARIVLALVVIGIAASLVAYAISPGVRHAVGHAAHSVKGAVVRVFDRDEGVKRKAHPRPHAGHHAAHVATPPRAPAGTG